MTWEYVGAFLTGVGAVLSSYISLKVIRKRLKEECDQRVEEIKEVLLKGIEVGKQ
jgi:hypothetical protein